MLIKVGVNKSQIITDNPKLLQALIQLYTFKVEGAAFTPAYKRRNWDGTTSFISNTGIFKSGLLRQICEDLDKIGCKPEINYESRCENLPHYSEIEGCTYRAFQLNLISDSLYAKRGIIQAPTGAGKTLVMAGMLTVLQDKIGVILFNSTQLVIQTYEFLKKCKIENLGVNFGGNFEFGKIMLSTVQSIDKIQNHVEEAEFLMVDEVHEFAVGKSSLAAINSFPNAQYRWGFTATVPDKEIPKYNLIGAFGPVIKSADTSSLVEQNILTKPIIQLIKVPKLNEEDQDFNYVDAYFRYIIHNNVRNNIIANIISNIIKNNPLARILVLIKNIEHGEILQSLIKDNCFFLQGSNDLSHRYDCIKKFLISDYSTVLIGTKILQTGINIEEITHFINARGLKSEIATLQALGRSLRKHESKDKVYVYDFIDDCKYLRAHSKRRKAQYKKEGHEVIVI